MRLLERAPDSGPWPCDYTGAKDVKLLLLIKEAEPQVVEIPFIKAGVLVAEADLRPGQIQDLADQVAEITKAAAGLDLKFHLRIELGGPSRPSNDVIARMSQLLQEISSDLKLRE